MKTVTFSNRSMLELPPMRIFVRHPKSRRFNPKYVLKHRLNPSKKTIAFGCIQSGCQQLCSNSDHAPNVLELHAFIATRNRPGSHCRIKREWFEENSIVCLENRPLQSTDLTIIGILWSVLNNAFPRRNS